MRDSNAAKPARVPKMEPMPATIARKGGHALSRVATPVRTDYRTTGASIADGKQNGLHTVADMTGGEAVTTRIAMRGSVSAGTTTT